MAATTSTKSKGPVIDPALCRCCRSIKKCRLLTTEYEYAYSTGKEVYSEMLMDCFGLLLSHLDGESKESGVCATCVGRLRDANAFRHQVLRCEEMFLAAKLEDNNDRKIEVEVKSEPGGSDLETGDRIESLTPIHEPDTKDIDVDLNESKLDISPKTKKRVKKVQLKKELMTKMRKLRVKMDHMLELPVKQSQRKLKPNLVKTKNLDLDRETMVYQNAVTIVSNSYVCPFLNRISMYYCYYCKDQFTNPNELREHTLNHDPKTMFVSFMDSKRIPKIDITRIDCRLCSEKIDNLETFKCHITTVHQKVIHPVTNEFLKFKLTMENLTCTECNNSFPFFDVLKKHMTEHFGTLICDICGACFLEEASLRTHIKKHSKIEMLFPCEICGKNLKSKYSKYLHIATVHEKKPTINCYKCEATFLSYALRNKHLIEAHGDKRTFPCNLCDKVYNRRKTLMEHNRRNHLKVFKHQCDFCEQKFYLPSRLKEHMATHTGERNFRCEFCDKSYPRLQSLQEHIRSHSNDRRFKCDICSTSFTQNGSLKSHMKSHHSGYDLEASFH